jgi:glycosyltransferase involved in cell wall biosynthesis
MKKILFFDAVAPYEYNFEILNSKGLGASESYLLSVANELKRYCDVDISTASVRYNYTQNDIVFKKLSLDNLSENYDTIIIQRDPQNLKAIKRKYPDAKIIIWLHDFFESSIWASLPTHELQYICDNAKLICVSKWHRDNFKINLNLRNISYKVDYNYFFIEDKKGISKLPISYDKNKLCFFSASHKGLEFTLRIFEQLYKINPKFKLYVGNPTYDQKNEFKGSKGSIINLHNQTRDEVLNHMKGSLATLHLNKNYPETFGCVNAESNMVGTPVLAYDLGATKEILYNAHRQLVNSNPFRVDLNEVTAITETIFSWYNGNRPIVSINPIFDKKNIIKKWIEII